MKQYQDLLRHVLKHGEWVENRTGVRTKAVLGQVMRFNLKEGFPAVTSKRLFWKGVVAELIFFIRGLTDNNWMKERGVHIWDEWEYEKGDLGPVYGYQWRRFNQQYTRHDPVRYCGQAQGRRSAPMVYRTNFEDDALVRHRGFDQLLWAENELRTNPGNRQIVVSAWNPLQIPQMALPPCHVLFQLRALSGGLHLTVYQRSCDLFLGVPFNIASYALLCHMLAATTGLMPGSLIWFGNDCHIYENHLDQVAELLARKPRRAPELVASRDGREVDFWKSGKVPSLESLAGAGVKLGLPRDVSTPPVWVPKSVVSFETEDFSLRGYDPHPPIKAEVAV